MWGFAPSPLECQLYISFVRVSRILCVFSVLRFRIIIITIIIVVVVVVVVDIRIYRRCVYCFVCFFFLFLFFLVWNRVSRALTLVNIPTLTCYMNIEI